MDNRFKYRAWNKYHKQMYDVYQIDFNYDLIFCDSKEGTTHTFGFIDCILMQCTGLKDKNGTLIFEGDKFVHDINDKVEYIVEWNGHGWNILNGKNIEIIGTIHD